jgi:hypothetical protein
MGSNKTYQQKDEALSGAVTSAGTAGVVTGAHAYYVKPVSRRN